MRIASSLINTESCTVDILKVSKRKHITAATDRQKAWRFSGEMNEIASTFEAAGIPGGFHLAAGDLFNRIAKFKGADPIPPVEDVLNALLNSSEHQGVLTEKP